MSSLGWIRAAGGFVLGAVGAAERTVLFGVTGLAEGEGIGARRTPAAGVESGARVVVAGVGLGARVVGAGVVTARLALAAGAALRARGTGVLSSEFCSI